MEHLANIPITILVKAPNQKIGDQTVECFMDWTVRRLKSHLSSVYPNKPTEKSQRIIYSGKLLQDHSVLKDVLRTDDSHSFHTVHLVCNPTPEEQAENDRSMPVSQSSPNLLGSNTPSSESSSSSRRTSVGESSTDGVRQRHGGRRSHSTTSFPRTFSTPYMQQFSVPGSPSAYQNMSPQQLQWMQHMYMQQMAAYYMQYHSGSTSPGLSPPWTPPAAGYQFPQPMAQPAMPNAPANQPAPFPGNNNVIQAAVAPEVPQDAPRVQNQQMNAGVGPAIQDEEEDGANRDWLDWIYTLCRFAVLLSIVYFYSSMNRFLLVAGIMFFVYLYENNFFRLRRRLIARVQVEANAPPRPEEEEPRGADTPDGGQETEDTPGDDPPSSTENNSTTEGDSSQTTAEEETPAPPEQPKPSIIGVLWIFLSTFFTSLVPQGPQHMNAN